MEWKQTKANVWDRDDGYSVALQPDGTWWAGRPNGLILRDGQEHIRKFGDREAAQEFVDRYHRVSSARRA